MKRPARTKGERMRREREGKSEQLVARSQDHFGASLLALSRIFAVKNKKTRGERGESLAGHQLGLSLSLVEKKKLGRIQNRGTCPLCSTPGEEPVELNWDT